MRNCNNI